MGHLDVIWGDNYYLACVLMGRFEFHPLSHDQPDPITWSSSIFQLLDCILIVSVYLRSMSKSKMIKVITNSEGSGNWAIVQIDGETVYSGSGAINPRDLVDILAHFTDSVQFKEVNDAEMDEQCAI